MADFYKNPKFIAGAIVVAWVVYVITANFQLDPIKIRLVPFLFDLSLKVSTVIVGSAIFGALATILIQHQWRRWGSSKPTSTSAVGESSKTVA